MKTIIFILTICIFLNSCRTNHVIVRLQNVSDYDFKEITISLGDTLKSFKNLKQGSKTAKFITNGTYGYGYTQIIFTNNDTLVLRPIDYVGETFYKRGKIKLKIDVYTNHVSRKKHILIKSRRQL